MTCTNPPTRSVLWFITMDYGLEKPDFAGSCFMPNCSAGTNTRFLIKVADWLLAVNLVTVIPIVMVATVIVGLRSVTPNSDRVEHLLMVTHHTCNAGTVLVLMGFSIGGIFPTPLVYSSAAYAQWVLVYWFNAYVVFPCLIFAAVCACLYVTCGCFASESRVGRFSLSGHTNPMALHRRIAYAWTTLSAVTMMSDILLFPNLVGDILLTEGPTSWVSGLLTEASGGTPLALNCLARLAYTMVQPTVLTVNSALRLLFITVSTGPRSCCKGKVTEWYWLAALLAYYVYFAATYYSYTGTAFLYPVLETLPACPVW